MPERILPGLGPQKPNDWGLGFEIRDGKISAWRDNVFVERLWRSVKYEEVYLHAYDTVSAAKAGLERYLRYYSGLRPHSSLDRQTPDRLYFEALPLPMAA